MIEVTEKGVDINIIKLMNARELWDLRSQLQTALFEYYHLIGVNKFREEMEYSPDKKKNMIGGL